MKNDELCTALAYVFYVLCQLVKVGFGVCGIGLLHQSYFYLFHEGVLLFEYGYGKLHRAAMQRTVLPDERAAVDTDHFMLRKGFL